MKDYIIKDGDTLSSIALSELRDADRWPELWHINCGVLIEAQNLEARRINGMQGPDWIFPGTAIKLPIT